MTYTTADYESDYKPDHKCPPLEDPTPKDPCPNCDKPYYPDLPTYEQPHKYMPDCDCPAGSSNGGHCLDDLIDAQNKAITDGVKAKAFQDELTQLLGKATAAKDEYTREKFQNLVKQWEQEDRDIVELLRKLECSLLCWRCIIECYVCPLLYDMRQAEVELDGPGAFCSPARDRRDLLYAYTRDRDAKLKFFNRIRDLLAAWEKPASTIEKVLADNAKLIADILKTLGTEPSKAVFDVFLKLIPLHLAIAPESPATNIHPRFTQFCKWDDRSPLCCCGINVGKPSLRERFIGPKPSLIDPSKYFKLICCLVTCVYQPAKNDLSAAEANVTTTQNQIKRLETVIENGLKNFEKNAKAAIPIKIDCDGENVKDPSSMDRDA